MHFHSKTVSALPALLVGAGLATTTFAEEPNLVSASVTAGIKRTDNRDLVDSGKKKDQVSWYIAPTIRIRKELVDLLHLDASYSPVYKHYEDCRPKQDDDRWEHTIRLNLKYNFNPLTSVSIREKYWWRDQQDSFYGDEYEYDAARDSGVSNDYYQNRLEGDIKQILNENGDYLKVGGRWRVKRYDEDVYARTNDEDEWGARGEFIHAQSASFSYGLFAEYTGWDRESPKDLDLGVDYLTVGVKVVCDLSGDGNHFIVGRTGYNHTWYEADDMDDQGLFGDSQLELRLFQQTNTQLYGGVRYGRDYSNIYPFSSQEDLAGYVSIRQFFGEDRRLMLGASLELRTRTYDVDDDLNPAAKKYVDGHDGKTEFDRDAVYVQLNAKYKITENFGVGAYYTYEDIDSEIASSYKENVFGVNATVTFF